MKVLRVSALAVLHKHSNFSIPLYHFYVLMCNYLQSNPYCWFTKQYVVVAQL